MNPSPARAWMVPAAIVASALAWATTFPIVPLEGDSAEIAMQGWNLGVAHPPGYPLAILWFHLARFLPGVPPMLGLSILNAVPAVAALTLGSRTLPRGATAATAMLTIGSMPLFWTYAASPEVFSGLALFASAFGLLLFEEKLYLNPAYVFLLALSILHHHTIVFLLPLLVWAASRPSARPRHHAWAIASGVLALAGYGLLASFSDGPWSWTEIRDIGGVWDHFLRKDYGTFTLMRDGDRGATVARFLFTGKLALQSLPGFAVAAALGWRRTGQEDRKRLGILAGTLALYLAVFTVIAEINPIGVGARVYARFLLMPFLLTALGLSRVATNAPAGRVRMVYGLLIAQLALNFSGAWPALHSDTRQVPGKHIAHALQALPKGAVLAVDGDSEYFTAGYWQGVRGLRPDVMVVPTRLSVARARRLTTFFPGRLRTKISSGLLGAVDPGHVPLFVLAGTPLILPKGMSLDFQDLVVRVVPDKQTQAYRCDPASPVYPGDDFPLGEVSVAGDLAMRYGGCDFVVGLVRLAARDMLGAKAALGEAVRKSPFHLYARERLCHVLERTASTEAESCARELQAMLGRSDPRYLGWSFNVPAPESVEILPSYQPAGQAQQRQRVE